MTTEVASHGLSYDVAEVTVSRTLPDASVGDLSHDHAELWLSPQRGSGIFVGFNSSG